jgi:hypothetical protein
VHSVNLIERDLGNLWVILGFIYNLMIFKKIPIFLSGLKDFVRIHSHIAGDLVRQFSPKLSTARVKILGGPLASADLARIPRKHFKLKHRLMPLPV